MTISRRGILCGLAAAIAAPAIVKAANIMPVRNRLLLPTPFMFSCYLKPMDGQAVAPGLTAVPLNQGWYRCSRQMNAFDGETIPLIVPANHHVYGMQMEWNDPGFEIKKGVKFVLRDTDGRAVINL